MLLLVTTLEGEMFLRTKQSRGGRYSQLVESYREDGKVKQRVVLYVGLYRTIDEALWLMPKDVSSRRREATRLEKKVGFYRIPTTDSEEIKEEYRRYQAEAEARASRAREVADDLAQRLEKLRELVSENPSLRSDQH